MKDKVIVWGTGKGFSNREENIREKYDIVAFTGNDRPLANFKYMDKYVVPEEIVYIKSDKVLICSLTYFETIKYQLINKYHIATDCIIGISEESKLIEKNPSVEQLIFNSVQEYQKLNTNKKFEINQEDMWLIMQDYMGEAGAVHKHYFAQDIWAGRKIHTSNPLEHYDIGSRLDGFISHLLTFMEKVNYIDIRPLPYDIDRLVFYQGDATTLEGIPDNSIVSLSSLHATEHFGLGRYGDTIDPDACFKAMKSFARVLRPQGNLYFSVPIGPIDKVCFNAHRIFSPLTILKSFEELELLEFAIVVDKSGNAEVIDISQIEKIANEIPEYSCGLFEFTKKVSEG